MGLLVWEQQRWAWLETTAGKPASSWRNTQQLPGGLQAPEVASQILFQGEGGERLRIPGSRPSARLAGSDEEGPPRGREAAGAESGAGRGPAQQLRPSLSI